MRARLTRLDVPPRRLRLSDRQRRRPLGKREIADSAISRRWHSAYCAACPRESSPVSERPRTASPLRSRAATMNPMPGREETRPTSGVKLTYDDLVLFPDDGQRHELIDGEHYVTPSPNQIHQFIVGNLHFAIRGHLETHPIGLVFLSPFDVVFTKFDVVEPDLLYISNERREILTKQNVQGSPDLVIEIGSPGTRRRDETIKRRLYERSNVSEYWVVDPDLEVVRVYRQGADGYGRPQELVREVGDVLT